MSPLLAALIGASTAVVCMMVALAAILRLVTTDGALLVAAMLLRSFSLASGYKSVVLVSDGTPVVVPFEELVRAFEKGDLVRHLPIDVGPRHAGDTERPTDGHA